MIPLILRPEPQASQLAEVLVAAGHQPVCSPLLSMEPGVELAELPLQLAWARCLIAVSRAAVEQADRYLHQHRLGWPEIPRYALGTGTASYWQQQGLAVQIPEQSNSEGLLALPSLQQIAGHSVLILRGDTGRELIADTLRRRGAEVRYCACYRRHWLDLDGEKLSHRWQQAGVDSVIISSGDLLQRLLTLLPITDRPWLARLQFVVPSARVADLVIQAGLPAPRLADSAGHAAFCAALNLKNEE